MALETEVAFMDMQSLGSPSDRNTMFFEVVGARSFAKQFASVFDMFRAATDANPRATIFSVDGIGAYDHVLRVSMQGLLATMLGGPNVVVCAFEFCEPFHCSWWDDGVSGNRSGRRRGTR